MHLVKRGYFYITDRSSNFINLYRFRYNCKDGKLSKIQPQDTQLARAQTLLKMDKQRVPTFQ